MDQRPIFRFLTEQIEVGRRCVLVTVLAVEGSAMRGPGAHMAVSEDGSFVGSLSGGCIEQAVVAEACDALRAGSGRVRSILTSGCHAGAVWTFISSRWPTRFSRANAWRRSRRGDPTRWQSGPMALNASRAGIRRRLTPMPARPASAISPVRG